MLCASTRWLVIASLFIWPAWASAQGAPQLRHRVFLYWGYNRAQYTASDIRFTGTDHDFTLYDVRAQDRPEPFSLNGYFNPKNIWIPQYNYRAGWFLNDRWSISLGLDHMKYVVQQGQTVELNGTILAGRSPVQVQEGTLPAVALTPDFLTYEHTDGLNLLGVDADHYLLLESGASGKQALWFTQGIFAGPVIPRTDVRLFGEGINNKFHLAGYGAGAQLGLFALFADRLFLRANVRAGWIQLPDVLTTGQVDDRASQHFWFVEESAVLGVLIGRSKQGKAK